MKGPAKSGSFFRFFFLNIFFVSSLLIVSALFATEASAYQLTYTSQPLAFQNGAVNTHGDLPVDYLPPSSFSINFNSTDGTEAELLQADITVTELGYSQSFVATANEGSQVIFNDDGSIAAWDFAITFTRRAPANGYEPPEDATWILESRYGLDSCNCDSFYHKYQLYTPRQTSWGLAALVELYFGDSNSPENWKFNSTKVPEPSIPYLFLTGLGLLIAVRLRGRKS